MKIFGLQKMTLLDYPGKVAATVFLAGCNLRCPFCHNYELVEGNVRGEVREEDFWDFLRTRRGILDGVAVTGGEPCINEGLFDFLERIKKAGYQVKLDTNGFFPDKLLLLEQSGMVDYIAMDIKNSPAKYLMTSGVDGINIEPVYKSISVIMNGKWDYEFRTTVVKGYHDIEDIQDIGVMISGAEKFFLQAFTDRPTVPIRGLCAPSADEMRAYRECAGKYVKTAEIRGLEA